MPEIAVLGVGAGMFVVAGVVAWCTLWRTRAATALRRVRVPTARPVPPARQAASASRSSR